MKKYTIFAGVNGAGKSTLYKIDGLDPNEARVNVDEIVQKIGDWRNINDQIKASKIAINLINKYFEEGINFNQETTLCGKSCLKNIDIAKEKGYFIILNYVGVDNVDIAKERVDIRVKKGGHDIDKKLVEKRYYESLQNLLDVIKKCDEVNIYDNTKIYNKVCVIRNNKIDWVNDDIQVNWIKPILEKYNKEMDVTRKIKDNRLSVFDTIKKIENIKNEKANNKKESLGKDKRNNKER